MNGLRPGAMRPKEIKQESPRELAVFWPDGVKSVYTFRALRQACRCAHCVNEWTGDPILNPESVSPDVHPLTMRPVGRYAVQFQWSDGHDAGIYTYEMLREMGS